MEIKICIFIGLITLLNVNVNARNIRKTNNYFHRENDMHDEYLVRKEFLKVSQSALRGPADKCECKDGVCERNEKGKMVCTCPPEWGLYRWMSTSSCKRCECGKGANCTFEPTILSHGKKCICTEGYKDVKEFCTDACSGNPCENGGTCKLFYGRPGCICKDGFYGDFCEKDLCSPNPCMKDGVCAVLNGKVNCLCKDGFTGQRCERDRCTPNPCDNGGTCAIVNGNATCFCKDSFTGIYCERERMPSTAIYTSTATPDRTGSNSDLLFTSHQPQNVSTVFTTNATEWDRLSSSVSFTATQYPSSVSDSETFPSTTSSMEILTSTTVSTTEAITFFTNWDNKTTTETSSVTQDLCSYHHCMNGGICREVSYRPRCFCISPFSGEFCEKDPCTPRPCVNGGTCVIQNTTFRCRCNEPFTGDFCERDPCTENPCQNGGTCFLSGYSFKCICKEAFNGDKCESSVVKDRYVLTLAALSLLIVAFSVPIACLVFISRCISKS